MLMPIIAWAVVEEKFVLKLGKECTKLSMIWMVLE